MRIAMIGQKGVPARSGGVEKHVDELSRRLGKQGHDVLVFCRAWYCPASAPDDAVTRVFAPSIRSKHLDAISHTFFSIVKAAQMKTDVFHIHGVGPALLAWLPKLLRPSAKVVVTFHCVDRKHEKWGRFARLMLHLGERLACRAADQTITVSKTLTDYCHLAYGADTRYIPNGVTMPDACVTANELARFDLAPRRYLLMVSRLVRHKGAHTLIAAWKQARETHPEAMAGLKLAIVGGGAFTDEYVHELTRMADGDDSIVLTGEQTGQPLKELFAHAYACVHPSTSEGLPIAILEEMSYGKCVLSSDIPENLELTQRHGMAFQTGDVDDLALHLAMLASAPAQVAHVGAEAARFVEEHYDWDEIALQTEMVYKQSRLPSPQTIGEKIPA